MGKLIVVVVIAFFAGFYVTTSNNFGNQNHCSCKTNSGRLNEPIRTLIESSLTDSSNCTSSDHSAGGFGSSIEVFYKNGIIYLFW